MLDRLLGPRALELAPLARVAPERPGEREAWFELRFDPVQVDPLARARLERAGGASPASLERGRAVCAKSVLQQLAMEHEDLELLELAARNAARPLARPRWMGVLNVTPDSFSDGGRFLEPGAALARARELVAQGADLLDIGGESTRPGALEVDAVEEWRRVGPLLEQLVGAVEVPLSIDTRKAEVARRALDLGVSIVNDVSAGQDDPGMLPLVRERAATLVLMHMRGAPRDMQADPRYVDVTFEVAAFLRRRLAEATRQGLVPERLWVDPGIGFGKRLAHNLELLGELSWLRSLGCQVLVGPSRKSFLAEIQRKEGRAEESNARRLGGTAASVARCVEQGADVLRVHDVAEMAAAGAVARAFDDARVASRA